MIVKIEKPKQSKMQDDDELIEVRRIKKIKAQLENDYEKGMKTMKKEEKWTG